MNLRSLDLNLLVVLDALLDEAHVSRAADRVGLSQPATSAALQRSILIQYQPLARANLCTARMQRARTCLRRSGSYVSATDRKLVQ